MVCIRKAEDPRAFPLMIDEEVCKHRILYSLGQGGPLECEHNRLNLHSLCKVLRIELATMPDIPGPDDLIVPPGALQRPIGRNERTCSRVGCSLFVVISLLAVACAVALLAPWYKSCDTEYSTEPPYALLVTNLPPTLSEEELSSFFECRVRVASISIVKDSRRESRGFGMVEFFDPASLQQAILANGVVLHGSNLRLRALFPQPSDVIGFPLPTPWESCALQLGN